MRKELITLLILLSAFMVIGCAGYDFGDETTVVDGADVDAIQISGADLYVQLTEEDNYKEWELWPGVDEMSDGKGPHGGFITVYVSEDALAAIENKEGVMPNGSIIVKDGFKSNGEPFETVVMYKVDGYNPGNNDWFWAAYSPEGEVEVEGKVGFCISCHARDADNDYLRVADIG